ncbi:MAG: tyrosine--tRNA ligase, partial [Candidatus Altarchaeaceae archaeon]
MKVKDLENLKDLKDSLIEIITEEEFDNLDLSLNPNVYCGYETSGPFHLGTMTTALNLLKFLNFGFKVKILFADVHTKLNRKGDDKFIDEMIEYWKRCFIALGLKDAEFVIGSEFQFERNYIEDVLELALETTVNRGIRSMQEVGRDIENARISQIIYPLMQIVDIKYLKVDVAYGGLEQRKIHMLAREILPKIYKNIVFCHSPLIVSLLGKGSKMSSSKPETMIKIDEEPEIIKKKISLAYCP